MWNVFTRWCPGTQHCKHTSELPDPEWRAITESLTIGFPDPEGNPHPSHCIPSRTPCFSCTNTASVTNSCPYCLPRSAGTQLICWVSPSWEVARTGGGEGSNYFKNPYPALQTETPQGTFLTSNANRHLFCVGGFSIYGGQATVVTTLKEKQLF